MHQDIAAVSQSTGPRRQHHGGGARGRGRRDGRPRCEWWSRLSVRGREGMEAPPFYEQNRCGGRVLSRLLLAGGEADSRAFEAVRAAFRSPKGTDENAECGLPRSRRPGPTPPACRWPTPSAAAACSTWRPRSRPVEPQRCVGPVLRHLPGARRPDGMRGERQNQPAHDQGRAGCGGAVGATGHVTPGRETDAQVLLCEPNISEGRDSDRGSGPRRNPPGWGCEDPGRDSDADHNRSGLHLPGRAGGGARGHPGDGGRAVG